MEFNCLTLRDKLKPDDHKIAKSDQLRTIHTSDNAIEDDIVALFFVSPSYVSIEFVELVHEGLADIGLSLKACNFLILGVGYSDPAVKKFQHLGWRYAPL